MLELFAPTSDPFGDGGTSFLKDTGWHEVGVGLFPNLDMQSAKCISVIHYARPDHHTLGGCHGQKIARTPRSDG